MSSSKSNMVMVLIATVALIAGTLTVYSIGELLNNQTEDPRESPHNYSVTGLIENITCNGEGHSKLTQESDLYFTYSFNLKITCDNGNQHTFDFGMIFDADDNQPQNGLYTYLGTENLGDTELSIWSHSENGYEYRFYVGDNCLVEKFEIASQILSLTGQITS